MDDERCECGHLFEICNHPNCALGDAQRPVPIDYADPQERWEGWPEPPKMTSAADRSSENG
jgi:hypothetical protein